MWDFRVGERVGWEMEIAGRLFRSRAYIVAMSSIDWPRGVTYASHEAPIRGRRAITFTNEGRACGGRDLLLIILGGIDDTTE